MNFSARDRAVISAFVNNRSAESINFRTNGTSINSQLSEDDIATWIDGKIMIGSLDNEESKIVVESIMASVSSSLVLKNCNLQNEKAGLIEGLVGTGVTKLLTNKPEPNKDFAELSGYLRQLKLSCDRVEQAVKRLKNTNKKYDVTAVENEFRHAKNVCESGISQAVRTKESMEYS